MVFNLRQFAKRDYEPFKGLFEDAYNEYLQSLRLSNPEKYEKEKREERKVTRRRFSFYLKTGSSFVAEEKGEVIGYVASQTASHMHGVDKLLWIEYIVVKLGHRRKGVATALLKKLKSYAKDNHVDRIYATINPDNEASIGLHQKMGFNVKTWTVASLAPEHTSRGD